MDIEPPAGDFLLQQDRKTELLGFVSIYGPNGCVSGFLLFDSGSEFDLCMSEYKAFQLGLCTKLEEAESEMANGMVGRTTKR